MTQSSPSSLRLFADSNVFVEALFVEDSQAAMVIQLVVAEQYTLATCAAVVSDVERAIAYKTKPNPKEAEAVRERWAAIVARTRLVVEQDASDGDVRAAFKEYISAMRHKNDIPILAAALRWRPEYVLSNNREHFNDTVSEKCGIKMLSCSEFISLVVSGKP